MNFSFWEKKYISGDTDVTILGSGIVGLSTAISLKEKFPSLKIKILERAPMPYGASTKNAGFACFGSVSELLDDIRTWGESNCAELVRLRWEGLQKLRSRVGDDIMEFSPEGGVEIYTEDLQSDEKHCLDNITYCNDFIKNAIGLDGTYSISNNLNFPYFYSKMITNKHEGSINPIKMINRLTALALECGVEILNGIHVTEINKEQNVLIADGNLKINYQTLCICTNGFTSQLLPELEVKPARNQVLITHPLQNLKWKGCYHFDRGYYYFRNYENRILLGGARNLDAEKEYTFSFGHTNIIQEALKSFLSKIHPGAENQIDQWWSGILGVGPSKMPVCRWVNDDIVAGVRLGGMGVAIGSRLGEALSSLIAERI
ncbi:MAG: FAD-binding oxidoreductase [Saprospiraceae bacterium]|nr:FAD-binding oxidoreductase [Saprospiraceae bacterium]